MSITLDDRLTGSLGGLLGLHAAPDELSLARTPREQLGQRLMKALLQPVAPLAP